MQYRRHGQFIILSAVIIIAIICVIVVAVLMRTAGDDETAEEIKAFAFDPVRTVFSEISIIEQNGVEMIPFKKIFESFGAVVLWNEQTQTCRASIPRDNFTASVKIGDGMAAVNGLETAMPSPALIIDDIPHVPFDFIKQLPGVVISEDINRNLKIWSSDIFIKRHGWTQLSDGLVAHAGGGLYKDEDGEMLPQIYTNSREALESSYGNGHRVFEMDFLLTSNGRLAAVHDWERVGGEKTSEEWRDVKIYDMYESLFIEDVYKFMLEHPDTFLVTDTKSFFYDDESSVQVVEQLVHTAKKMDESLLKRIVPQVYDQDCYSTLMGVYAFDSVIYTLYESSDTPEQVAEFVAVCDNIKVVAMMWTQLTDDFHNDLTCLSKYVYFFTINVPREADIYRMWGVRGFYTDYINPKPAPVPVLSPADNALVGLLRRIYRLFRSSLLIQGLALLFILTVKFIKDSILFLILAFLFNRLKNLSRD